MDPLEFHISLIGHGIGSRVVRAAFAGDEELRSGLACTIEAVIRH